MDVLVGVGVIQIEARCGKCGKLCVDFGRQLTANRGAEKIGKTAPNLVGPELSLFVHQIGDFCPRQNRRPLNDHQMQPHPQSRQRPRPAHRVFRRFSAHHQARCAKNPLAMGALHRLVDGQGKPEIVSRENDSLQNPGR